LSERIFDSSVDRGTPSLAAAPVGPDTRPLLAASAASTRDRSWAVNSSSSGVVAPGSTNFLNDLGKDTVMTDITSWIDARSHAT
jgi:hypothetical protein